MKNSLKVGVIVFSLAALFSLAIAGPVTGVWHGHIKVFRQNLPAAPNPQAQAQMNTMIQKQEQMVVNLTLKADHTFTVSMGGTDKNSQTGTWAQTGASLSLQGVVNGKKMGTPQVFVVAKNGKSFAMTQKVGGKDAATVTFSR
ncbi:MAG: hypothetical protein P4L46_13870 [Fimbriimonas sp.]|nr:hypothetical protein [Fimbriimonas sp.]